MRFTTSFCALILVLTSISVSISKAHAGDIYKWTDKDGIVHYSSKKSKKEAKPAVLPEIMRAEVKIPATALKTCKNHGGIDCSTGADSDGSVICYDGFKGAAARFRFNCNSPKLDITEIMDIDEEGYYKIIVRNSKSVAAENPKMTVRLPNDPKKELSGPSEISPFGVAEFKLKLGPEEQLIGKPGFEDVTVTCANCP